MKEFKNVNDILDFAIKAEQDAVDFYTSLANQAKNNEMKLVFEEFAKEEVAHKARLEKIKVEQIFVLAEEKVNDLKISDYLVDVKATPDMSYPDALVLAMKKEKAAFKLYSALAARATDLSLTKIFQSLALEESKHKLRFEIEYDDNVMREN